jgi:AAA domain
MYNDFTGASSAIYDFRKDFLALARPAYRQFNCDYYWRRGYLEGLGNELKGKQSLARALGEPWDISSAHAAAEVFTADLTAAKQEYDARTPEEIEADLERHKKPRGSPEFLRVLGKLEQGIVLPPSRPENDADRVGQAKHDNVWLAYLKKTGRHDEIAAVEQRRVEPAVPAPLPQPAAKTVECMFQRVGRLETKPREYIIKGFMPRNEVCNPFGRPDSFKGVCAAQLAVHIAGGVEFLGMPVKQAPTAYYAGERGAQVVRRINGHLQRLGLPADTPCYFGNRPVDLLAKADLEFLIANIKAIESDAGQPLGFLVIDTQSRTMGGDENSTKDGANYAKAIEAIRRATSATLWIVAHSGHDTTKQDRPRGSSALLGAYDSFYRFKKVDERTGCIDITTDRDGLGGKKFLFSVELYDTGAVNEDGEPAMAPYIEAALPKVELTFRGNESAPVKTTKAEKLALRALATALKQNGQAVVEDGLPGSLVVVHREHWREEFGDVFEGEAEAVKKAFNRAVVSLKEKGMVASPNGTFFYQAGQMEN